MRACAIIFALCGFALTVLADDYSKGDPIRLIKDTPLYFKDSTVFRMGRRGEQFTVIAAPLLDHRVYLSARNARGQEIALNVADDAIAPVVAGSPVSPARSAADIRAKAMAANGGKPDNEAVVRRGLQFLARKQNRDGSWGIGTKPYIAAMTGFSLLSFLGHRDTPESPEFGQAIKAAIQWVLEQGPASEGRLSMEPAFTQSGVFAHAIVTYALADYYSATRDPAVVELLTRATAYIIDGQAPDGGWMYAYEKGEGESDTSVSGWQIQALVAGHLTGLDLPGVERALDRAMLNLKRVQGPNGAFGYRHPDDRYSLTGVGVYCTMSWTHQKDVLLGRGIDYMLAKSKKEYPVKYLHEQANLYTWYYNTLACATVGGRTWQTWSVMFQDQITKNQSFDGSWPPLAKVGWAELQSETEGNGPLYRTNLCLLMLEVYYGHK